MKIRIINLAERIEFLDIVSQWIWKEWNSDKPLEYMKYSILHNIQTDRVPMTYVALHGEEPIGTVSIWMNDLGCRQDLYPWMASLFVIEEMRNKGIGTLLQNHAVEEAKRLEFKDLYLITDHNGYYEKFGWIFYELAPKVNGEFTRIYSKVLKT